MKLFKLITTLLFIIATMPVSANTDLDTRKINTIKKLYSKEALCGSMDNGPICKELFKSDNSKRYDSEYSIYGNATPDLKKVFDADQKCMEKYEGLCSFDYDIKAQSNDLDPEAILKTIKYEIATDGSVKVNFYHFNPVTLYYVMLCDDKNCLIDDILESNWENPNKYVSLKARVKKELAEFLQNNH